MTDILVHYIKFKMDTKNVNQETSMSCHLYATRHKRFVHHCKPFVIMSKWWKTNVTRPGLNRHQKKKKKKKMTTDFENQGPTISPDYFINREI